MMFYHMIRNRGPIPNDLLEFSEHLERINLECVEGIYRGCVRGNDGSVGLLFASNNMITAFQNGNEFSMDGTFDVKSLI